jgi:Calcineurin-like phosphoesterase/NACHT domain
MNILHITDLHFGRGPTEAANDERELALGDLISFVSNVDAIWKPDVICVSGDIAYAGKADDFRLASDWLKKLLDCFSLTPDRVLFCAGNHDIQRLISTTYARPSNPTEADGCLGTPIAEQYKRAFSEFSQFCQDFGTAPYELGNDKSFLTGVRHIDGVRFVSMNSSWFCRDKTDTKNLWIGLPLLRHLEAAGQWPKDDMPCVALLHHPREDLNTDEINAYSSRPNTYDYICTRSDILLSGHKHGEIRPPDRIADRALVFSGGATYAGSDYNNSFQILRLVPGKVQTRSFAFDPRTRCWQSAGDASEYPIGIQNQYAVSVMPDRNWLGNWKELALSDLRRIRTAKSRAATPFGNLPVLIDRQVAIQRVETRSLTLEKEEKLKATTPLWPLFEAVRRTPGRRALLLGDLGTGKSTLLCDFVERTLEQNAAGLAFVVPATFLRLPDTPTLSEVLAEVTRYLCGQIGPSEDALAIEELLSQGVEVTIAIDGLDEISLSHASKLLLQLAAAIQQWPTLQIVAASRPIELRGVDYSAWNVLTTLPITKSERQEIIRYEWEARGKADGLDELVETIEADIEQYPAVAELLSSPLTVRLFSPRLGMGSLSADITLGDLLLDVFEERLGKWAERDLKQSITPNLDAVLPSARSRAQLLGEALIEVPRESELTREILEARLLDVQPLKDHPQKVVLVREAINAFLVSGLLQGDVHLTFPLQAFKETAFAYGLTFSKQQPTLANVEPARWREVSFSAALSRRTGGFAARRAEFVAYLQSQLNEVGSIAAAASVVVESQDPGLAVTFIRILRQFGSHPLNVSGLDRDGSARAIATAMRLAGDDGFNWFYDEYLDPRYPVRFAGSAVLDWVFAEWQYQIEPTLSAEQKERLAKLVRPHISAGTFQVHNLIARISFVTPQAFSPEERIYFAAAMLPDLRYRKRALAVIREGYEGGHSQIVENVLGGKIWQGFEDSGFVASILLQHNVGCPPVAIIRSLLRARARSRTNAIVEDSLRETENRLGTEVWTRALLWLLSEPDASVAASAALILQNEGAVKAEAIRDPLLLALHDGAYVRRAEEILSTILKSGPRENIYWLANKIRLADPHHGGYSGWWRIFLENIETLEADGPRVLGSVVSGLSSFVLPRNSEIRQRLRELVSGNNGSAYRDVLRAQLDSFDPDVRRSAAAILVTTDPRGEAKALYVAVQALDERRGFDWHEWYDMCLILTFGPGPLTALESQLDSLGSKARRFALRLLFRNGISLDREKQAELVSSLLELYSFSPNELTFLASNKDQLTALLESEHGSKAAEQLLRIGSLDLATEATCWILASEQNIFSTRFDPALRRALEDSNFYAAIETAGKAFAVRDLKPLLPLLVRAVQTGEGWKDVLWHFFMRGENHSKTDNEVYGLWAMNYGKSHPNTGGQIGIAAKALLEDRMLTQQHRGEPVQWIALLADEFSSITPTVLEQALVTGSTIEKQAACAVIARLGSVPQLFLQRNRDFQIPLHPVSWTIRDFDSLLESLRNFSRDADTVPEGTCDAIQELLYGNRTPSSEELNTFALEGPNGSLIGVVLRYCFRCDVKLGALIEAMGRRLNIFEQNNHCMRRLAEIWRATLTEVTVDGSEARSHFIAELQRFINERRKVVEAATELFRLGELPPAESLTVIFDDLISNHSYRDDAFLLQLSHLPVARLPEDYKAALSAALTRAVSALNLRGWDSTELGNGGPATFLTTSLYLAAICGKFTVESSEVFYRGVKFLAVREPRRDGRDLSELFQQIEPLIALVPLEEIAKLFRAGLAHPDAVVRAVSRFALAAVGNQKALAVEYT